MCLSNRPTDGQAVHIATPAQVVCCWISSADICLGLTDWVLHSMLKMVVSQWWAKMRHMVASSDFLLGS